MVIKNGVGHSDRKASLDIQVIKTQLLHMHAVLRWIPHDSNVADAFTKLHGNAEPLLSLLDKGYITLIDEEAELSRRKEWREEHGGRQNPRSKRSMERVETAEPLSISWEIEHWGV
eukprot:5226255-Amphidinium_carterae.1